MGGGDRCGEGWVWVIGVGRDWWGDVMGVFFLQVLVLSFSLFFIPKFLPGNVGTGLGSTASVATGAMTVKSECCVTWWPW